MGKKLQKQSTIISNRVSDNIENQTEIVFSLLKEKTGLLFGSEEPSADWYEGVSEKIYRSVHVKIPHDELYNMLQNKNTSIQMDSWKHAIATFLGYESWSSIFIQNQNPPIPENSKQIKKSFYILILIFLAATMGILFVFRTLLL